MAIVSTPSASTIDDGAQISYPMTPDLGIAGQIATIGNTRILSGSNETSSRIAYGVPLGINSSGLLPNSVQTRTTAGALIGISARSHVFEKGGPPTYEDGIPPGSAVNILTAGTIYLQVWEAVAATDALRFFKSGANAGFWGKTASAGNSLLFPAGNWAIRKGGSAGQVIQVEFNFPAGVSLTAD
jgi:hypothetical protein